MTAPLVLAALLAQPSPEAAPPVSPASQVSIVELYSSEGCSSCPPADALIDRLSRADPGAIVLEFQVDYWNDLGWSDPFSSADASERQRRYAGWLGADGVYTPQAVIDGREGFVGSDGEKLAKALSRRGRVQPLGLSHTAGGVELAGRGLPAGELWIAVTESGLQSQVLRGENRGRTLKHAPIVRRFTALGQASGDFRRRVAVGLDPAWKAGHLAVVAALQDPRTGAILAAGQLPAGG